MQENFRVLESHFAYVPVSRCQHHFRIEGERLPASGLEKRLIRNCLRHFLNDIRNRILSRRPDPHARAAQTYLLQTALSPKSRGIYLHLQIGDIEQRRGFRETRREGIELIEIQDEVVIHLRPPPIRGNVGNLRTNVRNGYLPSSNPGTVTFPSCPNWWTNRHHRNCFGCFRCGREKLQIRAGELAFWGIPMEFPKVLTFDDFVHLPGQKKPFPFEDFMIGLHAQMNMHIRQFHRMIVFIHDLSIAPDQPSAMHG